MFIRTLICRQEAANRAAHHKYYNTIFQQAMRQRLKEGPEVYNKIVSKYCCLYHHQTQLPTNDSGDDSTVTPSPKRNKKGKFYSIHLSIDACLVIWKA